MPEILIRTKLCMFNFGSNRFSKIKLEVSIRSKVGIFSVDSSLFSSCITWRFNSKWIWRV